MRQTLLLATAALLTLAEPLHAQEEPSQTTADYRAVAQGELQRLLADRPVDGPARNVIIFIGDGMGVSTLTAARIWQGQAAGTDGESYVTAMDSLPHAALVKTYSHDTQVADSAPTANAIMTGVKTRNGSIGVGPEVAEGDCRAAQAHVLPTIFGLAQAAGRATGIISTARITHATPAATYAHVPDRDWEAFVPEEAAAQGCQDIALQLVEGPLGSRFDLILGGGRAFFLPGNVADTEHAGITGRRKDGRDLIAEWQQRHPDGAYVWNRQGLEGVSSTGPLLGLFEPDHMQFDADRDAAAEPSLAELTRTAITRLQAKGAGFVLLVEGGRIDHGHHAGNAYRALTDAAALDAAVAAALELTDAADTLVVTTADHSHTLTINGYPDRGNPILALARVNGELVRDRAGRPYTTLQYANGPGAMVPADGGDLGENATEARDYLQRALVPLGSETHGGEDVAVRARGPQAHLFKGTIEQNTIFAIVKYALFGADNGEGGGTE